MPAAHTAAFAERKASYASPKVNKHLPNASHERVKKKRSFSHHDRPLHAIGKWEDVREARKPRWNENADIVKTDLVA
mgnify:CR=1 FL=1